MAKPKFEAAKGHLDFFWEDSVLRNHVRDTLRSVFERYGYPPLETPLLENKAALAFKGGGEIQKEVFQLQDQKGRELGLRFDMTIPFARFVASNPDLKFPFKRHVIGPVFRDGPYQPEQGRYRSFTQMDVDVAGVADMAAEAELFALAQDAFNALGLGDVEVKINNRKLLEGILDYAGVSDSAKKRTITILDKLDKIGRDGVSEELNILSSDGLSNETFKAIHDAYQEGGPEAVSDQLRDPITAEIGESGCENVMRILGGPGDIAAKMEEIDTYKGKLLDQESIATIMDVIQSGASNEETYKRLSRLVTSATGKEGIDEVRQLLDYAKRMDLGFIQFDPSLARGLDYYTGTTIEVYLTDRSIVKSAILAGGRFDDMVGDFRGSQEDIPAVGFSFGLERLCMILKEQNPDLLRTTTELYLIPMGTKEACLAIAHSLRRQGVNTEMELVKRKKLGMSIGFADYLGVPYVGIVGENELDQGVVRIKNLSTGVQNDVKVEDVASYLKQ